MAAATDSLDRGSTARHALPHPPSLGSTISPMSNLRSLAATFVVATLLVALIGAAVLNGEPDSWFGPALLTLVQPLLIGAVVAVVADVAVGELRKR